MPFHQTALRPCALCLERANPTHLRGAGIHHVIALLRMPLQSLSRGTKKCVCGLLIFKLAAIEQCSIATVVHSAMGGYVYDDALSFTLGRLLGIAITGISYRMHRLTGLAHRCLGCFCHGLETAIIGGFIAD